MEINRIKLGTLQKDLLKALADLPICEGKKTKNVPESEKRTIEKKCESSWLNNSQSSNISRDSFIPTNQCFWRDFKIHKT